jgi:lipoate-protein ligase A
MNRVIVESLPHSGAWNMAVDEALLETAVDEGKCTLRFYRWSEPTVSLGYFQKPEEATADPLLAGLPIVPRLSGGGAILHHHEWTYSIALPPGHPLGRIPVELYDRIHDEVIGWLRSEGVPAMLRRDSEARHPVGALDPVARIAADEADTAAHGNSSLERRAREPFLCFGRGDPRDIVLHGSKILGSAQRRRRGAILQHGSLLLRGSPFAPQFSGLLELSNRPALAEALPGALVRRCALLLGDVVESSELPAAEFERASLLISARHSSIPILPN